MTPELFWSSNGYQRIRQAEADARAARADVDQGLRRVQAELDERTDKAMLICHALWTFVHERLGVTEDELLERIKEIDLTDGELDGRVAQPLRACAKCERTLSRRRRRCLYCGHEEVPEPFAS